MPLTKNQTLAMAQAIPYDLYQITAPVNRQNRKQGDPCHTLARDNAAHAAIAIQDVRAVEKAQNGRGWNDDGSAYTVDTHATQGVAVAIQGTLIGRGENAGPQGSGADVSGAMFTLTTRDVHAVAFGVGEQPVDSGHLVLSKTFSDQTDSLTAGYGKGWNGNASADNGSLFVQTTEMAVAFGGDIARSLTAWYDSNPCADRGMDVVAIGLDEEQNARVDGFGTLKARMEGGGFEGTVMTPAMQVRRLTPVECERLQGFPDGYTNIPWRNKDESPDGPRYKALGNSMAVPVMRWIGERINKVEAL